jgi:hypothetical protein
MRADEWQAKPGVDLQRPAQVQNVIENLQKKAVAMYKASSTSTATSMMNTDMISPVRKHTAGQPPLLDVDVSAALNLVKV